MLHEKPLSQNHWWDQGIQSLHKLEFTTWMLQNFLKWLFNRQRKLELYTTFHKISINLLWVIPNIFIFNKCSDVPLRLFILPYFSWMQLYELSFTSKMNCKFTYIWIICCPHFTPQGLFLGGGGGELTVITSFCKNLLFVRIKGLLSLWASLWKKLVKKCSFPGYLYH